MKKIKSICGVFATMLFTTTVTFLFSCSQEDDDYDTDMYTLAEHRRTRLAGENDETPPSTPRDTLLCSGSISHTVTMIEMQHDITFNVSWAGECILWDVRPNISVSVTNRSCNVPFNDNTGRYIPRYKFIKSELGGSAVYENGAIVITGVKIYYQEANGTAFETDGTYGAEQYTLITTKCPVPEDLKKVNK